MMRSPSPTRPRSTLAYGDRDVAGSGERGSKPSHTHPAPVARPAAARLGTRVIEASQEESPVEARAGAEEARYISVETLGAGAMGEVRLAVDARIGRNVAIKRMTPDAMAAVGRMSLLREGRTIGRLEHPNIVPIHDLGVDAEGEPYVVMKLVEGETIEQIIDRLRARDHAYVQRFSFEARMEIFLGVLRALEYAHTVGVLHRDVKPSNVMVGPYGEVVLMDWGIAIPQEELPARGEAGLVGTPLYMSPEQARGENASLDARSDLYSAAALFHELVTLRHYLAPLEENDDVLRAVGQHGWRLSLLDWHRPGPQPMAPMELYHFLRRALAFEKHKRFAAAREMIDEIERIVEGRIRVQCHITLVKRSVRQVGRFVDRRPWLSFGIFATAVLTVVASAVSLARQALTALG